MESIRDEFLSLYQREALDTEDMPARVTGAYRVEACLRDTKEKQTFLLREKESSMPVLMKRALRFFHGELRNEYAVLCALDNEFLPHALSFFEDGQYVYLLREYIPGESLYDRVGRLGTMSEQQTAHVASLVCDCLAYLHSLKPPVIHRDVKPQNVIITPEGKPVLIDLGAARKYRPGALQDTVFMGTQATAAPEQYGFGQTDARCDIYALGMLMIYLLTGEFRADDAALAGISKPLRALIGKCVRLDPKRRWANANALKSALCRFEKRKPRRFTVGFIAGFAAGICFSAVTAAIFISLAGTPAGLHAQGLRADSTAPALGSAQPPAALVSPSAQGTASLKPAGTADPTADVTAAATPQGFAGTPGDVHFSSPLLEKAVRFELNKNDDEPISEADLSAVTEIAVCGDQVIENLKKYNQYCDRYELNGKLETSHGDIESLQDLRRMKNLNTLVLDRQNVQDLTPLQGLPLKYLELSSNRVTDLTPLKQCPGLVKLSVNNDPVKDLSPLAALKHLETLDISFTGVSDISGITTLPIRELEMFETPVRDYEPLKRFAVLETLGTRFVPNSGLSVIYTLSGLKSLAVLCCEIDSLDSLSALTNLESLNLNTNNISDLSKAGKFPKLRYLDLASNPIQDLKPLKGLQQLYSINIADSGLTDLTQLFDLPVLHSLNCDLSQANALKSMRKNIPFELNTP